MKKIVFILLALLLCFSSCKSEPKTPFVPFNSLNEIPIEHKKINQAKPGKIEKITYKTKDYSDDLSEVTKSAFVYLPNNYDSSKKYPVLYLLHGVGGTEAEWQMTNNNSLVKKMMDNLIEENLIEPFIIVTPNGRSSKNFKDISFENHQTFYQFGKELRNDLKLKAMRPNAIVNPVKVIIDNYPEGQVEYLDCPNNPENEEMGSRKIAFSREVYIDRDDFIEEKPNKKWKRLALNVEVRLMHAYFITANSVEKDSEGNITCIHATYDPLTRSGSGFNERKPNGNINFVEATTAVNAEFRLFEPLMLDVTEENKNLDFMERLNPNSLNVYNGYVEAYLKDSEVGTHYQFVRNGYYVTDKDSTSDKLVFNRTCGLKSSFKL